MSALASWRRGAALGLALCSACSGSRESDELARRAEAARLLHQASFGPTLVAIERAAELGREAWLDEQMALAPSLHRPLFDELAGSGEKDWTYDFRVEAWWRRVLRSEDQLRQRVAWALSQIFVISDRSDAIAYDLEGLASYYDLLLAHAFGDYRELLEAVTLSPQMGGYLSMLQNQKPNAERNVYPDENYAREVMQLFSIGLVELDPDGSWRLDEAGAARATFDQAAVEGLAHAFTGWNYATAKQWETIQPDTQPMVAWEEFHDTAPKRVVGDARLEGGGTAREELEAALDLLAGHPNVGPFLGRQLIQRLVASNPSAAYVERVAAVFDDDGEGVRGNLGAVVRAILLDPEACEGHRRSPERFGKLREPLLRVAALWRAFDARSESGWVDFPWPDQVVGQAPLRSPTVFNFYRPDHIPPGELTEMGLAAPELALATHTYVTRLTNELLWRALARPGTPAGREEHVVTQNLRTPDGADAPDAPGMVLDIGTALALAQEGPAVLIDHLDLLLLAGEMSTELRGVLMSHISEASAGVELDLLVRETIFLVVSSPRSAVQR